MKVFISQSKPRSRELALVLAPFIRRVIRNTDPWVSDDIDKGARFRAEIQKSLTEASAGICCLTSENLDERWILYEAGALSVKEAGLLWTLLLDVEHTDVLDPLADFLHTATTKDDMWKMIQSIHKAVQAQEGVTQPEEDVKAIFEALWPIELGPTIEALRNAGPPTPPARRSDSDLLLEAVERIRVVERTALFRSDKTLKMLHHVYEATTGRLAPSLKELHRIGPSLNQRYEGSPGYDVDLETTGPVAGSADIVLDDVKLTATGKVESPDTRDTTSQEVESPKK